MNLARQERTYVIAPVLLLLLGGCSPQLHSLPASFVQAGPSATLDRGQRSLEGRVALIDYSEVSGTSGEVMYHHALSDALELEAGANAIALDAPQTDASGNALLARIGARHELGSPHLSASFGAGGGASAMGTYLAADLGLGASYDNEYFVPYLTGRLGLSVPVSTEVVAITDDGVTKNHRVRPTEFWSVAAGFRVKTEHYAGAPLYVDLSLMLGNLMSKDSELDAAGNYVYQTTETDGFSAFSFLVGYAF